jgi:Tfp pilus assembly PilM family ATPase
MVFIPFFIIHLFIQGEKCLQVFKYVLSRPSLGLDVCDAEIRLLALRLRSRRVYVEKMNKIDLPFGAVIDGKVQQPEVVASHLKKVVQEAGMHGARTTIALPMQSVICKKIPLHESSLITSANEYFPGLTEVLAYDYIQIQQEILLIATRQDELMRYVAMVESAGLKVCIVDVDLYARTRAVHFALSHQICSYPIILLELMSSGVQIMLLNQHEIIYQQVIYGDLDQMTAQLQTVRNVYLLSEKTEPKKIYLVGDGSSVVELINYIRLILRIDIERIDPFALMSRKHGMPASIPFCFLACCGLALRGMAYVKD